MLEIKNLTVKVKNDAPILTDVSLSIDEGTCIGLTGASGSGKTTLIKAAPHNKAKRTVLPAHSFWQNGLRLEFSQKAYGFKPPGRACQPEADSPTRI